nr:MAG TPA: hypothetical protein [Caudoviricetes sp.]
MSRPYPVSVRAIRYSSRSTSSGASRRIWPSLSTKTSRSFVNFTTPFVSFLYVHTIFASGGFAHGRIVLNFLYNPANFI